MRKRVFGRRFKRNVNQRKALFKSLINSLVINGRIQTTEAKAKAIKGEVEKLITKARNKGDQARDHLLRHLNPDIVDKILLEIAPRFKGRPGGYTRILRLGTRMKDNARMVLLEFVESSEILQTEAGGKVEPEAKVLKAKDIKTEKAENKKKTVKKETKAKNEKSDKTNKKK